MSLGILVQWGVVAAAIGVSAGFALLVLLPAPARRWLAARLGQRGPRWLQRRLAAGSGCAACPAQAGPAKRPLAR